MNERERITALEGVIEQMERERKILLLTIHGLRDTAGKYRRLAELRRDKIRVLKKQLGKARGDQKS